MLVLGDREAAEGTVAVRIAEARGDQGAESLQDFLARAEDRGEETEDNMPKLKTHRGAAKRFKVTGTGKVKRSKAFKSHILTKKTTKRKRQLDMPTLVSKADQRRVSRCSRYK